MKQKLLVARLPMANGEGRAVVLYEEEEAVELYLTDPSESSLLNNIYLGHVAKVIAQAGGAFVRFQQGEEGFLPFGKIRQAVYKNKKKDQEICPEDELLVRVDTDALKTKKTGLSAELTINGKFLVISNGFHGIHFSKKLNAEEKEKIADFLKNANGQFGFIVRTSAVRAEEKELTDEAAALEEKLEKIIQYGVSRPWGTCLYRSPSIWMEKFHQLNLETGDQLVTDDPQVYEAALEEMKEAGKERLEHLKQVRFYEDKQLPLYRLYNLSTLLSRASEKKVWLKSGASIIIEQTEAFVCIDVNSSKAIQKKVSEEEFLKINLEAATEIARQIRLRRLSGTILIDFINMKKEESEKRLLTEFRRLTQRDHSSVKVVDITPLGIMELSRRKRGPSLQEQIALCRPDEKRKEE